MRALWPFAVLLLLAAVSACLPDGDEPTVSLTVNAVDRVVASRAFGGPLPLTVVDVTVENTSEDFPIVYARSQFSALGGGGVEYAAMAAPQANVCQLPDYIDPALAGGSLGSMEAVRAKLVFANSSGTSLALLLWDVPGGGRLVTELAEPNLVCPP